MNPPSRGFAPFLFRARRRHRSLQEIVHLFHHRPPKKPHPSPRRTFFPPYHKLFRKFLDRLPPARNFSAPGGVATCWGSPGLLPLAPRKLVVAILIAMGTGSLWEPPLDRPCKTLWRPNRRRGLFFFPPTKPHVGCARVSTMRSRRPRVSNELGEGATGPTSSKFFFSEPWPPLRTTVILLSGSFRFRRFISRRPDGQSGLSPFLPWRDLGFYVSGPSAEPDRGLFS